jgi:hypothetical protein
VADCPQALGVRARRVDERVTSAACRQFHEDVDQPIGALVRKRVEQRCVHDAEDRRVRTDAQRERETRDEAEARMMSDESKGVPDVTEHRTPPG